MRSSNPALNDATFEKAAQEWAPPTGQPHEIDPSDRMTFGGTLASTAVLLVLLVAAGAVGWMSVDRPTNEFETLTIPGWFWLPLIGGLGVAFLTVFKPHLARFTAPLYAVLQGLVVGTISAIYDYQFSGIVLQAVGLTIGVIGIMLFLYATRIIKVTEKLRMGIVAATGAVCLIYIVSLVANLFGADVPYIHDNGLIGIGFSLAVVGIAAFNLLLDFDLIEAGVAKGAPSYMEWYASFGLLVTIVWLYLEMLRLLSKIRR
jgi:uncharacterized YccA/Bax inhibitor family protein